ncbi:[histone H3]-lysine(4) N-trimethyltransferase [Malassezia obtusa]|uniref:Histone-lysine N-methyltransferase, H3 lysine-79 specific n=1 Tax=Malassezia obtusa TaxID=76774 RepID=A0AAF0E0F4_9BASI|nr:[histone H3]-lysine(4) N-trimethyltransferase [Malassezia obtusa]
MDFFGGAKPKGRAPGRTVVTTSRVTQAPPAKPKAQGTARHNALPDSVRQRIEHSRAEAADAKARADAAAAARARAEAPRSPKRPKRERARAESPAAERPRAPRSLLDQRPGTPFHYHTPRTFVPDAAHAGPSPMSSRALVESSSAQYGAFFDGLQDEPVVSLEYPAQDAQEEYVQRLPRFLLLVPKDADEYDPISDLLRAVGAIVAHYIPPERQDEFGALDALDVSSNAGALLADARPPRARLPSVESASASRGSTPNAPERASSASTSQSDETLDSDSILRSFTKARNRRHGPLFVRTVHRFNALLRAMKAEGIVEKLLRALGATHGVPEAVWRTVQDQVYARAAAPHVEKLKQYEAFSDNVYGEMLPPFLSEVCRLAQLGPDSVMVDLGSGIGNLVVQAAMQTGCRAYGCEYMPVPAELAAAQLQEATARWSLWHLRGGPMETWCADFTDSEPVRAALRDADLVVANNYAFRPQTNDTLSLLFLDLKDGAMIVSLRSFVPHDFRLTERTLSSPAAILRVEERTYRGGCVSWTGGSGKYYVHIVDRSQVRAYAAALEQRTKPSGV